ncbi:MAG: glycosyltransferase family 2 protein [Planctomycetota bacterium]|nr:glycosyltransferase family 2 protein [Planctomycetota bacterium]
MKIAAVIPALNEAGHIESVVRDAASLVDAVIVVDDGSTDATAACAQHAGARVVRHHARRGKGSALRSGFACALDLGCSAVVTLDGDGQHDPHEIPKLIDRWHRTRAGIVIGSRMGDTSTMPVHRQFTNRSSSAIVSLLCSKRINDTQSGYRLVSSEVIRAVKTTLPNYEMESELLVKAARAGFAIVEVPVRTIYRADAQSKIHPLRDTWRFLATAVRLWRRA